VFGYARKRILLYQFGFKPRHSTSLCTSILKQTVEHFTSRGSHVFMCFVDFKKAFDSVNHWKLLDKLLDDNVNYKLVKLLGFGFSRQVYCVRWRNSLSSYFNISNGTRQEGVLSPYLFSRYIRELLGVTSESGIGCKWTGQFVNMLMI